MFVGIFTTKVLIRTSTITKEAYYSLTYNLLHLFVIRISFRGHLRRAGNDLRRIVNINSWHIEPKSCQPCSRIYYTRDRCYCFEHVVEPLVDSYILSLLLVYKIGEKLSDVFYCFLYIHKFKRFRWRRGVLLQKLSFLILGNVQTICQTAAFYYL